MRRTCRVPVLVLVLGLAAESAAQYESAELLLLESEIAGLAASFSAFDSFPWRERDDERAYVYGDGRRMLHLRVTDGERSREEWKSVLLVGTIQHVFAEDLDQDGTTEIVAVTSHPRMYVWETEKYDLLWESTDEKFEKIQAVALADVDRDPAIELVIVADSKIAYYDGAALYREKQGRDFIDPTAIVIGDVDGDLTKEIVTNDGYVIDTETLNIEWAMDGFGDSIRLFDVDSDGIPEVVGVQDGALVIWDVEERRAIW